MATADLKCSEKTVKTLSNTLTAQYENDLKTMNAKLQDLGDKQRRIAGEIRAEGAIFVEKDSYKWLDDLKIYRDKLIMIKKDMAAINNRTRNISRKAKEIEKWRTGAI